MKVILFALIFSFSNEVYGNCSLDTIANWQIYYGNKLISSGNENQHRVPKIGTLTVKGESEKLKIFYQYDAVKPEWRTIVIKNGQEVLFTGTQHLKDNHPSLINLKEILDKKKVNQFTIQIYYTDDITKEKNRFIGEIEIKTK